MCSPKSPGEGLDGDGNVLEEGRLARRSGAGDLGVEAIAQGPDRAAYGRIVGEGGLVDEVKTGDDGGTSLDGFPAGLLVGAVVLDEESSVSASGGWRDDVAIGWVVATQLKGRGVHQLGDGDTGSHQGGKGLGRGIESGEVEQGGDQLRHDLHSVHDGRGDEPEGSLGTDHEVGEDLGRVVIVEEGIEPITHGVLARELEGDLVGAGLLTALIAQCQQGLDKFRLVMGQFVLALGVRGIDDSSRGQYENHGIQGPV